MLASFSSYIDKFALGILVIDEDYNVVYVNDAYCNLFNLQKRDLISSKCYKAIYNKISPCAECKFKDCSLQKIITESSYDFFSKENTNFIFTIASVENKNYRIEFAYPASYKKTENDFINKEYGKTLNKISEILHEENYDLTTQLLKAQHLLAKVLTSPICDIYIVKDRKCNLISRYLQKNLNKVDFPLFDESSVILDAIEDRLYEKKNVFLYSSSVQSISDSFHNVLVKNNLKNIFIMPLFYKKEFLGFFTLCNINEVLLPFVDSFLSSVSFLFAEAIATKDAFSLMDIAKDVDSLTKLYTRSRFFKDLSSLEHKNLSCFLVNVNDLRGLNNRIGFDEADKELLKIIITIKEKLYNLNYLLYRVGADEFLVVIKDSDSNSHNQIFEILTNVLCGTKTVSSCVSDVFLAKDLSKTNILDILIVKMQQEKSKYYKVNKKYKSYRVEKDEIYNILQSESKVKELIATNAFIKRFQPIVDIKNNKIVNAEISTVLSYNNAFIPNTIFKPILETHNLVSIVDFYLLEEICRLISQRKNKNLPIVPILFKISSVSFFTPNFIDEVSKILNKYPKVVASDISLEISEKVYADKHNDFILVIQKLKNLGFLICIDNFGLENSNLTTLINMPVDIIKIKPMSISEVSTNEKLRDILKALVAFCNEIKIQMVFEGIFSKDILDILENLHIYNYQGDSFYKVGTEEDLEKLLSSSFEGSSYGFI